MTQRPHWTNILHARRTPSDQIMKNWCDCAGFPSEGIFVRVWCAADFVVTIYIPNHMKGHIYNYNICKFANCNICWSMCIWQWITFPGLVFNVDSIQLILCILCDDFVLWYIWNIVIRNSVSPASFRSSTSYAGYEPLTNQDDHQRHQELDHGCKFEY